MSTAFDSKSVEHVDKGGLTKESFMTTNPVDRKNFPATNWAHQCWQQYNIYMLCVKKNSGDEDACSKEKFTAYEQCPLPWIESFQEQRDKDTFLGVQLNGNPWEKRAASGHH